MSRLKELRTPIFWAEGHPGKLNRESWVIEVSGLCANPKTFTWQELIAFTEIDRRRPLDERHPIFRAGEVGRREGCRFT